MYPPQRIACLTGEMVETIYLLGEQDRVVGISGYVVTRRKSTAKGREFPPSPRPIGTGQAADMVRPVRREDPAIARSPVATKSHRNPF
jgi:hypothetical protein